MTRRRSGEKSPILPTSDIELRVVGLMRRDPLKLWTPGSLARELRLGKGTIRKALWRVAQPRDDGRPTAILRLAYGLYRSFLDASDLPNVEIPPVCFHAFQVHCTLPQNRGWGATGQGATSWGSLAGRPVWERIPETGQWARNTQWDGRLVTLLVTPSTGNVQVSLRASKDPVPVERFGEFKAWLEATLQAYGLFWSTRVSEVNTDSLELNQDYKRLGLNLGQRVSLQKFENALVQIYQKRRDLLRIETRIQSVKDRRLTLEEVASIITTLTTKTAPDVEPPFVPSPDPKGPEVA